MAYRIETDTALGFVVYHVKYLIFVSEQTGFVVWAPRNRGEAGGQPDLSRLCYAAVTIDRVVHWPALNLAVTQTWSPPLGPLFLALHSCPVRRIKAKRAIIRASWRVFRQTAGHWPAIYTLHLASPPLPGCSCEQHARYYSGFDTFTFKFLSSICQLISKKVQVCTVVAQFFKFLPVLKQKYGHIWFGLVKFCWIWSGFDEFGLLSISLVCLLYMNVLFYIYLNGHGHTKKWYIEWLRN